jgi:hypothetical protein
MARQDVSDIGIELLGDKELGLLFNELKPNIQNQIINEGYRRAGRIILNQAVQNFKTRVNDKGVLNLAQYFTIRSLKSKIGCRVGVLPMGGKLSKSYIVRFLERGVTDRKYTSKRNRVNHFTGSVSARNFFSDAVNDKKDEAEESVQQSIVDAMNKIIQKYSKM